MGTSPTVDRERAALDRGAEPTLRTGTSSDRALMRERVLARGLRTAPAAIRLGTMMPAFPMPQKSFREYIAVYQQEHRKLGTRLTHMVGIPMIIASIPTAFVSLPAAGSLFVGGWALQYIGHYVFEKNEPAFFSDPYYLMIGPLWVAAEWMTILGLPVPEALTALTPEKEAGPSEPAAA